MTRLRHHHFTVLIKLVREQQNTDDYARVSEQLKSLP